MPAGFQVGDGRTMVMQLIGELALAPPCALTADRQGATQSTPQLQDMRGLTSHVDTSPLSPTESQAIPAQPNGPERKPLQKLSALCGLAIVDL
jgi:hypothetical protein